MGQVEQSGANAAAAVDVCVCTFRRPHLYDTLASIAAQTGAPELRVIVADNDDITSATEIVERARAQLGLVIHYIHAPARNISVARNACLDAATASLVAFLDDDERAAPGWLHAMVTSITDHGAVFGPVRAVYPAGTPNWLSAGDFHSTGPTILADGTIRTGYSGNVLLRRDAIGPLRFDPELGRVGGEDSVFFAQLFQRGVKLGFASGGAAEEDVPANRLNLSWLLRRSFRAGQTAARMARLRGESDFVLAALSVAKASYCAAAALLTAWSPLRSRRNLIRGALHVGALAKALGARDLVMYGAPDQAASQSARPASTP
ncbi:MAG: glycosyltransferase family 2 protein [Terricaulis sp.]